MVNILRPPDDRNFPYWPGPKIQQAAAIPASQRANVTEDIPLNNDRYSLGYFVGDVARIPRPEVLQDRKGATEFLEASPALGRGSGVGLTDMLLMSIAKQQEASQK